MNTPRRQTLENRAERLGYFLTEAGLYAKMDAANNDEPAPRWELTDGKWQRSTQGYRTLADVAERLDQLEVTSDYV